MQSRLIDSDKPFRPVYSIYKHQVLGCLIGAYVVQELPNGRLSLAYQGIHPETLSQFSKRLDETDRKLVKLLEEIGPKAIFKKFGGKVKSESDFFLNHFKEQVQKLALAFVNRKISEAMPLLLDREVFLMGNDGYPAQNPVKVSDDQATVLFHFRRDEQGTRYFATIKLRGEKISIRPRESELICVDPAWMLVGDEVFSIHKHMEGNKLKPFLGKPYIQIPPAAEKEYFHKFVPQLVERYDVYAIGFEIKTVYVRPEFRLYVLDLGGNNGLSVKLKACYRDFELPVGEGGPVKCVVEEKEDNFIFHRISRHLERENEISDFMNQISPKNGLLTWELMGRQEGLAWLGEYAADIRAQGIIIIQSSEEQKLIFDTPRVEIETKEEGDWFDVRAIVVIGEHKIPFLRFRNHILHGRRDFKLPDGTVAILPESWFTDYRHLLEVAEEKEGDMLKIRSYQAALLDPESIKIGSVVNFRDLVGNNGQIPEEVMPQGIRADLRGYQKRGYDWLKFLGTNKLGGILADDMGLGKTLQTLTLLQHEKEKGASAPSLIVMPTSLLYNWAEEAKKFAPTLRVHLHAGLNRAKEPRSFQHVDLILTTYGTVRQDITMLRKSPFHYLILDESQMIKNPDSKTAKAVRKLLANHRLSLTGTPLENTLMDLWSQMTFLNPGLLGSETFFRHFYAQPIEKFKDVGRMEQLRKIIHPFILRRTKEQVATELPPKVEQVHYCEMSEEQEKLYEETKNAYRNYLLNLVDVSDFNKNKLNILAGLQKLRQIAIHPRLVDGELPRDFAVSGKYKEFMRRLEEVLAEKRKVLVFSQFVKLLSMIEADVKDKGWEYAYLDGQTRDRKGQVDRFQKDPNVQVFLISLKAGGVGLNLTAAEYVFILDPWWNPAVEAQAVDRSHRIGQEKTVFSYKFITRNSIEEKILKLQEKKANLSNDIVSVEDDIFKKLEMEDLRELLA